MAGSGWKTSTALVEWLFAAPWEFDFFQALKILEQLAPEAVPVGQGADPAQEGVQIRSRVGFDFPASDLYELNRPTGSTSAEMIVNFAGLAGAHGPLPNRDAEQVIEQAFRKDTAFRDFLDMFNHRVLSLMYRVRKMYHPSLAGRTPDGLPMATHLFSLFGLGLATLRGRMAVPDRALLYYSGILAHHRRSASGLLRTLSDYFRVGAEVVQLQGRWRRLEPEHWTVLGASGRNCSLGQDTVIGTRFWEQQGKFEVRLGPLSLKTFMDFLPSGQAYYPLCALTRFYVGKELDFAFRLTLAASEVPDCLLGRAKLGWTSWVKSKPFSLDDSQVCLTGTDIEE
jgi:type VI secretion system protein ImpH